MLTVLYTQKVHRNEPLLLLFRWQLNDILIKCCIFSSVHPLQLLLPNTETLGLHEVNKKSFSGLF